MSEQDRPLRVFCPGGRISVAALRAAAELCETEGAGQLRLGPRQELLLPGLTPDQFNAGGIRLAPLSAVPDGDAARRNVTSTRAAVGVAPGTPWLDDSIFHHILSQLDFQPAIGVHLADPMQPLEPVFAGELNFLATPRPGFWRLVTAYATDPHRRPFGRLFRTEQIADAVRWLHRETLRAGSMPTERTLAAFAIEHERLLAPCDPSSAAALPAAYEPCEGFFPMSGGREFGVGLFYDEPTLPARLVRELCESAASLGAGELTLSHWRALVFRNVPAERLPAWRRMLGACRIRLRHDDLALHWLLDGDLDDAHALRGELVGDLRRRKVVAHGISFAIARDDQPLPAASILIRRSRSRRWPVFAEAFDLLFRRDMNPNSEEILCAGSSVRRRDLADRLYCLIDDGYAGALQQPTEATPLRNDAPIPRICPDCGTLYDPAVGDTIAGVPPGVDFERLSADWRCPVCDQSKQAFIAASPASIPQHAINAPARSR